MKRNVLVTSLLLSMGSAAWADSTQDEIALLKEQLKMLTQKIEKLEAKSNETEAEVKKVAEAKTEEKASWADRITFQVTSVTVRNTSINAAEKPVTATVPD